MKIINPSILLLLFSAQQSYAHPGHDHSHWSAGLVHLLWLAPVLLTGAFLLLRKKKQATENARNKVEGNKP